MSSSQQKALYRRILVPMDGSALSEAALEYAKALAAKAGAEVFLLHIVPPQGHDTSKPHKLYLDMMADRVKACIKEERGADIVEAVVHTVTLVRPTSGQVVSYSDVEVTDPDDKKVHTIMVLGPTSEQILGYAEDNNIDLIVMATHGRSTARRWPLDSVAVSVARCSTVPVRLVRVGAPNQAVCDEWPDKRIVVLLDGSEASEQSLPYIAEHARLCGAAIDILRVYDPSSAAKDYPKAKEAATWQEHSNRSLAHQEEEGAIYLDSLRKRLETEGLKVTTHSASGDSAEEIIKYVSQSAFDLVAMTTHATCGVGVWPLGSTTDKVLHGASNPLLLVHPK